MKIEALDSLSPFVRHVKITKSNTLAGEWLDYDNVFTYIEQGEAVFVLGGTTHQVTEGDAILMHPFMPHIIRSTSTEPLIQYIFHFDCYYDPVRSQWDELGIGHEAQQNVPEREMLFRSIVPVSHIRPADRLDVNKRFLLMHKEFMDEGVARSIMLKSIALELLAIFLRNQTSRPPTNPKITKGWSIIEKCIHFIRQNYHDATLDNLRISEHADVSPNYLSYLFKEELGVTVRGYLNYVRIEEAKKRILKNEDTLTQIAEQIGFSSIHHFSRAFKNMVGMTASRYMAVHSRHNHGLND